MYDTSSGRWRRELATVCITVTHNGDFDAFEIYGQTVDSMVLLCTIELRTLQSVQKLTPEKAAKPATKCRSCML